MGTFALLVLGAGEAVGLLLFAQLRLASLALLLAVITGGHVIRDQAWRLPPDLLKSATVTVPQMAKLATGAVLKLGITFLALFLAGGHSPFL